VRAHRPEIRFQGAERTTGREFFKRHYNAGDEIRCENLG